MDEDVEFTEEFTALGENKAPLNATTPQSMCLFSSRTSLTSEGNHMLQLCSTGFMVWERITLQNNDRTVLRYRSIIDKYENMYLLTFSSGLHKMKRAYQMLKLHKSFTLSCFRNVAL